MKLIVNGQYKQTIIQYSNSMAEDQGISEISMSTTEQAKVQQQPKSSIIKHYFVSLILIIMGIGFYFLIFGIIELVTNYSQHKYTSSMECSEYECVGRLYDLSFPDQLNVYIYLLNSQLSQNLLQGINTNSQEIISNCQSYATNQQVLQYISLTGINLTANTQAYPCGQIAMFYPQSTFTIKNIDTNSFIDIKQDDLSITHFSFTNIDTSKQWANVQTTRYSVWSEKHIALGIKKYWGYITQKISGNFQIRLTSNNKLKHQLTSALKVEVTDNLALSGYNIQLCVFNFMWAVVMFILGCFSFYVIGKQKHIFNKNSQNLDQNIKQSIPQYSYSIHS